MKTSLPVPMRVVEVIRENYRTKTFVLDGQMKAVPGQFVMVWLPGVAEKPLSLTQMKPLTITVMEVGEFTRVMNRQVKVGDRLWVRGPFGEGVYRRRKGRGVLVAGGCGCVPLYAFALGMKTGERRKMEVVLGARKKKELMFKSRFEELGLRVRVTTDDGSAGRNGRVTDELIEMMGDRKMVVYGCGPGPMLKAVAKLCEEKGVEYQLSLEAMMKCAFGICGACSVGGRLVCKDGPVFSKWPEVDEKVFKT